MRKIEALPYNVEESMTKIIKALTKASIEYYTAGREIYINEDLLLNENLEGKGKSFMEKIKDYLRNDVKTNYAIISFEKSPGGSYLILEYANHATFSKLVNIFNLKPENEVAEETITTEINDTKLERELSIIKKDISGEKIDFDEENGEEEYDYIEFGERNCKVCGSIIRRITVHDKDGNLRDCYKCTNTNCLKIYIIR